jgi:glycosyltransferase involved in cell wall biosynthesis
LMATGVAIWKDVVNDSAGLTDDETPEGFARLMQRWLVLSDEERSAMRSAARRSFEDRFTLDGAANTLTVALSLLIGVHRDSRWDSKPLRPAAELP